MFRCLVCLQILGAHNAIMHVYYCQNPRCTRYGLLTVMVIEEKKKDIDPPIPVKDEVPAPPEGATE